MMTDTEIRTKGVHILYKYLGDIEMGRFFPLNRFSKVNSGLSDDRLMAVLAIIRIK